MTNDPPSRPVLDAIRRLFAEHGVTYRELEHAATPTSEDSARERGEPLSVGAKALLMKVDDTFAVFVLPADRKLDSQAVKKALSAKKLRFATGEELLELTGLTPGSLPPFGRPIFPLTLYADELVGVEHGRVAFNAGLLTRSMILATGDWERVAKPQRFVFSKS